MPIQALLPALRTALTHALGSAPTLTPLPDTGLAHWHVRLDGSGWLARVPKQSQMGLPPADNLAYEAACFERCAPSGHVPALHSVISPSAALPWGALLVQEIRGQALRQPQQIRAAVQALAAIHQLPVPDPGLRAPLHHEAPPLAGVLQQIRAQATYLTHPWVDSAVARVVEQTLGDTTRALEPLCAQLPVRLISFDAHPGNFLITPSGQAILVDLEKARYSYPPLDLAHATLYTSTSWDVAGAFTLTQEQIAQAYQDWLRAMGPSGTPYQRVLLGLRQLMWLWSVSWCAQWLAQSGSARRAQPLGQDWSQDNSAQALVAHVHERVTHYLSPMCVQAMRDEFAALAQLLPSL